MLTYSIGIPKIWDELSRMQSPGLYWINCDRELEADLLGQQLIQSLSKESRAALITCGKPPQELVSPLTDIAISKLPLFTIPQKKKAFFHLFSDLLRYLNISNRLIVLHVNSDLWSQFTHEEMTRWMEKTRSWIDNIEICLVVLCHGSTSNRLQTQLTPLHRLLDGFTHLHWRHDCVEYSVSWWGSEHQISGKMTLMLKHIDGVLCQSEVTNQERPISINDDWLCLCEKSLFAGMAPPSENWHFFETKAQLIEAAKRSQAATVIFTLSAADQVEQLARQIHLLRINSGNALKLVVREMRSDIRNNDEALLQACGANLILPATISLSQLMMMIDGVQNQMLVRYVPENFETLLTTSRSITFKGILSPSEFCESVLTHIKNTLLSDATKGILIGLRPVEGLKAEQALSLCDLRRIGDIASAANDVLYLFLSSCRINDVNTALSFILRLPVNEAFSSHKIWHKPVDITKELKNLTVPGTVSKMKKTKESASMPLAQPTTSTPKKSPRRIPSLLSLPLNVDQGDR